MRTSRPNADHVALIEKKKRLPLARKQALLYLPFPQRFTMCPDHPCQRKVRSIFVRQCQFAGASARGTIAARCLLVHGATSSCEVWLWPSIKAWR